MQSYDLSLWKECIYLFIFFLQNFPPFIEMVAGEDIFVFSRLLFAVLDLISSSELFEF